MSKHFTYTPKGVCSRAIDITVNETDHVIEDIQFMGGCSGNTQGVAALCKGEQIEKVIPKIQGIRCGFKSTSCPDQLSQALKLVLQEL